MPVVQLFADDFTGYANQAAFEAAYPYDVAPGDTSSSVTSESGTWGLTNGPGGVPGVQELADFSGSFDKFPLSPTCRQFSVRGRWDSDFAPDLHPENNHTAFITMWWAEAGNRLAGAFAGNMVQLTRNHTNGNLTVTVKTTPAYGNGSPSNLYFQIISAALPHAVTSDVQVDGQRSTITETSPGVFAPDPDGFVRVSVNGVQVFEFLGPVWHGSASHNDTPYWNGVSFSPMGRMTAISVWHEVGCVPSGEPPFCPCEPPPTNPPKLPPTTPPNPPPQEPTIGEQLSCEGNGLVPTQDDFAPSEFWWGL